VEENKQGLARPVLMLVLDGIRPSVLQDAIGGGEAPALEALAGRGEAVWDAVSVFPSITPAATAAIVTGEAPGRSGIVGHAWYDRGEGEVIVYGATTETVISTGPLKVFHNNVWRMNRDHLRAATLFERLHEFGVEGACVNFPIRRGPYEHPVRLKIVKSVAGYGEYLGEVVSGPKEYYLGDIFYTRDTGLQGYRGLGGLRRSVGINDEYAAAVGARLVRERAAPFTLVYFYQGDSIAHHYGLEAQRRYVGKLDEYVAEILRAGGGLERVLEEYAVVVLSDHGHTPLMPQRRRHVRLAKILGERAAVGARAGFGPGVDLVAVPNGRSALLYFREGVEREVVEDLVARRGIDLAAWREEEWCTVRRLGREISFRPGTGPADGFGCRWELRGDPGTLDMEVDGDELRYGEYPDALGRLRGALESPRCGDVILSATPGYTFGEVSGKFHEASDHGSLHASDSNVFVLACGLPAPRRITDVAPMLLEHFERSRVEPGVL
jgi:hypothetical protein